MVGVERWPLKAIRQYCLECSGSSKQVMWCTCDGVHSTRCPLWPFRFGIRPETARQRYGERLLTPECMPDADVDVDELPSTPRKQSSEAPEPVAA